MENLQDERLPVMGEGVFLPAYYRQEDARRKLLFTGRRGHLLARVSRTRSIGRLPDVEKQIKSVLQASLTPVFIRFSPPCELLRKNLRT